MTTAAGRDVPRPVRAGPAAATGTAAPPAPGPGRRAPPPRSRRPTRQPPAAVRTPAGAGALALWRGPARIRRAGHAAPPPHSLSTPRASVRILRGRWERSDTGWGAADQGQTRRTAAPTGSGRGAPGLGATQRQPAHPAPFCRLGPGRSVPRIGPQRRAGPEGWVSGWISRAVPPRRPARHGFGPEARMALGRQGHPPRSSDTRKPGRNGAGTAGTAPGLRLDRRGSVPRDGAKRRSGPEGAATRGTNQPTPTCRPARHGDAADGKKAHGWWERPAIRSDAGGLGRPLPARAWARPGRGAGARTTRTGREAAAARHGLRGAERPTRVRGCAAFGRLPKGGRGVVRPACRPSRSSCFCQVPRAHRGWRRLDLASNTDRQGPARWVGAVFPMGSAAGWSAGCGFLAGTLRAFRFGRGGVLSAEARRHRAREGLGNGGGGTPAAHRSPARRGGAVRVQSAPRWWRCAVVGMPPPRSGRAPAAGEVRRRSCAGRNCGGRAGTRVVGAEPVGRENCAGVPQGVRNGSATDGIGGRAGALAEATMGLQRGRAVARATGGAAASGGSGRMARVPGGAGTQRGPGLARALRGCDPVTATLRHGVDGSCWPRPDAALQAACDRRGGLGAEGSAGGGRGALWSAARAARPGGGLWPPHEGALARVGGAATGRSGASGRGPRGASCGRCQRGGGPGDHRGGALWRGCGGRGHDGRRAGPGCAPAAAGGWAG